MNKEQILNEVLQQIENDINNGDLEALEVMLSRLNEEDLLSYLSEEVAAKYE